jgi:addiction module RelE/StbE family toxin
MIGIFYDKSFLKSAKKLSDVLQLILFEKIKEIQEYGISHPTLRTKSLSGKLSGFYSFRLNRSYRCLFHFINQDIILLDEVAHRKGIYNP